MKSAGYDRNSLFQFLDSKSAALQYLPSFSPLQSSSPLPQSSLQSDDWWLSSCLAPTVLDPIREDDAQAPLSSSTPDLSLGSPHSTASYHSRSSTFEKHSSKSSLTSESSRSRSSSPLHSDSPLVAHTNTDYDFDNTYERDDEFTDRLYQLLLVVAREREREHELQQSPERVLEYNEDCFCESVPYAYRDSASVYTDVTSPPCVSSGYELSPLKIGMSLSFPRIIEDEYNIYALSSPCSTRNNYLLRPATVTASPTLYSPSVEFSPLNQSSFFQDEYPATPDTEIDTLVFASPSCSPPARTLKRPRSLSINQTDIDSLSSKRKLRKIGYSVFSS